MDETRALLGREPKPYTAGGVQAAVSGLAKPLFGVSVRPSMLGAEAAWVLLVALLAVFVMGVAPMLAGIEL